MIQYVITNELKSGAIRYMVADYSARVRNVVFATNARGFAECSAFIPMGLSEAFSLYDTVGLLRLFICDTSSGAIYDGRVEDIAITGDGVTITALGFSRALSDVPYTALWSKAGVADWRTVTPNDLAGRVPERWQMDTNNRLFIAQQKNASYGNGIDIGALCYLAPDGGSRTIVGAQFDYQLLFPVNWLAVLVLYNAGFTSATAPIVLTGTGALITGSISVDTSATPRTIAAFQCYNNTGAPVVYAGETGANYFRVTNLRIVSSVANRINTTSTTAAFNNGANVVINVASSARMYVGQRLVITSGANSESAVITVINSSTQITVATIANAPGGGYPIGSNVQAHVIYADEIADDLITTINTLNPGQLSSSLALTDSPALDLQNEVYEDRLPADILDYLAGIGDAAGNQWEWGVKNDQRLFFRQQNNIKIQRVWYIDVSEIDVTRLIDQLTNSVYAVYADASGRNLRTAPTSDTGSIARYGLTKRAALSVSTTSATQAGVQQATALADGASPQPQSGITISQVFDASGARWPLWYVQAGDTVVIRNLAPTLSTSIDRIRVFRLARAEYAFDNDTLNIEPETPLPKLDALLAKLAAGVK